MERLSYQGVCNACAVVTVPNVPSVAFHKRMGFASAGILPNFGYKMDEWHGVEYLYRRLKPVDQPPKPLLPPSELPPELLGPVTLDR